MKRVAPGFARAALVVGCALLAGCGAEPASQTFAPPDYGYLPKLRFNVASLSVVDHAPAGEPDDLAQNAPTPPEQALEQMARQRLVASGNSGSAVFTIDQASILGAGGGGLDGRLAVHLDILTAGGGHVGYAEAHVSRQFTPGSDSASDGTRAALYSLTRQMMRDMNVEFEYQVRRTLSDWLVDASGAPVAGSVGQQTLAPPTNNPTSGGNPASGGSVGNTPLGATPLAPTAAAPSLSAPAASPTAPTSIRSPPPGFLSLPSGGASPGSAQPSSQPPMR